MNLRVVTGYVPISGHPRTPAEYGALGENLFGAIKGFVVHPFYEQLEDTWLYKSITQLGLNVTPSVADNPEKNTIPYHCVNHQKFGWLLKSLFMDSRADTFVWVDYGLLHVRGVTPEVVTDFLSQVKEGDFAIPGCWDKAYTKDNYNFLWPSWRFCGGLMVVPRDEVAGLYKAIKRTAVAHISKTKNVCFEVNTLTRAEHLLPKLRWYKADHNETMLTNYGVDLCKSPSSPASVDQSGATSSPISCTTQAGMS